jgi:HPt (histidine-containing phosphotransfer) domain-containing protein
MSERITVMVESDLEDLVPGFLENRRKDVTRIEALLVGRDFDALRKIGHSLKGVGGGYGFDPITDLGATIEKAALQGDDATIRDACRRLADYLDRVDVVFTD